MILNVLAKSRRDDTLLTVDVIYGEAGNVLQSRTGRHFEGVVSARLLIRRF